VTQHGDRKEAFVTAVMHFKYSRYITK